MIEIIGNDGIEEIKIKIDKKFWISESEYMEFKEKLEELIEEYKI